MAENVVVICLGEEPRVYGLFVDEVVATGWLKEVHCVEEEDQPEAFCDNWIIPDEHHVLPMILAWED